MELHQEKMQSDQVTELWIKKLTMAISWLADFAVDKALAVGYGGAL